MRYGPQGGLVPRDARAATRRVIMESVRRPGWKTNEWIGLW